MGGYVVLLTLFVGMWLLVVRPQQQRLRAQRALVMSLEVGDRIVTAGGIVGTISGLDDRDARVEVAPGVEITFLRAAMSRRLEDEAESEEHGVLQDSQPPLLGGDIDEEGA